MAQHEEHQEQVVVIIWSLYYKQLKNLMAIPNGSHLAGTKIQRAKQVMRLKKEGMRVGAFDLFLPLAMKGYHGMWIEMKRRKGGKVSDDQKEFQADMEEAGYHCVICNGADEAIKEISNYIGLKK